VEIEKKHQNSGIIKIRCVNYTAKGQEMKTIPANKIHSPLLLSSSGAKCTEETIVTETSAKNTTYRIENCAQTKFICKSLMSVGPDPIQQTTSVVSRNIQTAVMKRVC